LLFLYWLLPRARGQGAAERIVEWAEARLREIALEKPHTGNDFFTAYLDAGEHERDAVLAGAGYLRVQTFAEMSRSLAEPIPDLPLPDGLVLRPATAADARAVWEADDVAFRDHVGYSRQTEVDYQRWLQGHYNDPALWKVAFEADTGAIAGQVLNYVNAEENAAFGRSWGYTESISVQRAWRRRGVARALIAESMRMFRDMGLEHVALGVHTTNPNGAFPLYEGLGYRVTTLGWELRKALTQ
jgi:ribosomal protein S18 acetylase RimI-like enzyme